MHALLCWTLYYFDRSFSLCFNLPYLMSDQHISCPFPDPETGSLTLDQDEGNALEVLFYGMSDSIEV